MSFYFPSVHFLQYFLKREATQFFLSVAIRKLALGMILIFEPIYIFLFFQKNLPLTLLFFAGTYGIYGILVVFFGKILNKIGLKHAILISHFFYFGYYLSLYFLPQYWYLIIISLILRSLGMSFFWPAFHIDFCRFSEKTHQGKEVGKLNLVSVIPGIFAPAIGGWILERFNYAVLFTVVLIVLFTSTLPMFLSKEIHIIYSDSFKKAWERIFDKKNKRLNIAFLSVGVEWGINIILWPLFMLVLGIKYGTMGWIITFSLGMVALFGLYLGSVSDRLKKRVQLLNIGTVLTSISWILKYFVTGPFTALLSHTLYRICRVTARIPYHTFFYEKASLKGEDMEEFIIYREIVHNISRSFSLIFLSIFFYFVPKINIAFLVASFFSLGFMFLGIPPKLNGYFNFSKNK